MCQDCATGSVRFSRRDILKVGAAGAVALAIPSVTFAAPAAVAGSPSAVAASPSAVTSRGTQLVLLGTAGGPPVMNGHSGIASVLQVDGRNYVIDCGRGAVTQYKAAGLRFDALASIFITHLHADHLADYYDFFLLEGWGPVGGDSADRGIVVRRLRATDLVRPGRCQTHSGAPRSPRSHPRTPPRGSGR